MLFGERRSGEEDEERHSFQEIDPPLPHPNIHFECCDGNCYYDDDDSSFLT